MLSVQHKREQWKIKRKRFIDSLSPDELKEVYAKCNALRTAKRAAKAIKAARPA